MSYCAYCLKECATSVKMCNHFKNGAYFYKECQTLDCWSPSGTGQWHFNWCAKCEYVEEDCLNLNLVPIPNKDLGLQNKNVNRAGFKILTESVYTELDSHSGILDLVRDEEVSLQVNFSTDCLAIQRAIRHVYDEMD